MKLFLIDGHALVFKMYYAFLGRPMVNGKGVDTSILFGFTKYLLELVAREKPTHLAVAFDPPGGTFRNEIYPEYKANRNETPSLVVEALEPLVRIVGAMGIPVVMVKGFEADDVIGTLALRFSAQGADVYMVTPDKDYGQLVSEHVLQYKPGKGGGDSELLGPSEICEKWGIDSTAQVIDMLTICGDASDNVPGVHGVGPVGASKLLRKYSSVEGIYAHLQELTPRQREMFEQASGHIALSRELVTIRTDVPLEAGLDEMLLTSPDTAEAEAVFDEFEFPSLKRMLRKLAEDFPESGDDLPEAGAAGGSSAVSGELDARRQVEPSYIKGSRVAILYEGGVLYAACREASGGGILWAKGHPSEFAELLSDASCVKAGHSLKAMLNVLRSDGFEVNGRLEDTELLHYLLSPESSHAPESLALSFLGVSLEADGAGEEASLFDEPAAEPVRDLEVSLVLPLADCLKEKLSEADARLPELYDRVEEPLINVLSRMEMAGVKIDLAALGQFADRLRVRASELETQVREVAGDASFNVNSPRQVGELVFGKLNLAPGAKKPAKGSWPADEKTLQELSDRHPVIEKILEYRSLRKLLGTYIDPLPSYVSPVDGRVHTTFNQALTSTGRLSSSNPNLQNIPVRTELGREIRKAFIPDGPGKVIMSADYSQIELRIMAHLCGDEHLCGAFLSGTDVHSATAAKIFGVPVGEVTADMRRMAKTANFGIMYGISSFGLSQNLGCSRAEARRLIDDYFASFPMIRSWIDATLASARADGYVETLFGRRRYIPGLNAGNAQVRAMAERNAVNAPIQGTSADIIKLAMTAVDRRLLGEGLSARMVLQIHDELLLEVPLEEVEKVSSIVTEEMQGVIKLKVPLTVECKYGTNWLEAH